jgi:hypothetical protein
MYRQVQLPQFADPVARTLGGPGGCNGVRSRIAIEATEPAPSNRMSLLHAKRGAKHSLVVVPPKAS